MRRIALALLATIAAPLVIATPAAAQIAALLDALAVMTPFKLIAAATDNATVIKPSAGRVEGVELGGIGAVPAYLKFYDKATLPVCNVDVPVKVLIIAAAATAANGAANHITIPSGFQFVNGIGICVVTGIADNDDTAVPAATYIVNIDWR